MKRILFAAFALGLLTPAFTSRAAEPEPLAKVGEYRLKRARYGAAAVSEGDYVYVIGGTDRNEFFGSIERFDVKSHRVVTITDALIPRRYLSAAVVDHKIYILGGWDNTPGVQPEPVSRVEIFDLATGKITFGPPPLLPRSHAAAIAYQGKILLIGGQAVVRASALVQTNQVEIFDPATGQWAKGRSMPTPRETAAALVGDFILVPGGFAANAARAAVEYYLPQKDAWQTLPDLCQRMSACSVVFLGDHLFLFGNYGAPSEVLAYHLKTRTSRLIRPGYTPVHHTAAVVNGGQVYVIGGNIDRDGNASDLIQVFALTPPK